MTQPPHDHHDRDHVDHEHAPQQASELDARTLAAIDLWDAETHGEPMPAGVRTRCLAAMHEAMDTADAPMPIQSATSSRRWIKPAAIIALAASLAAAAIGVYALNRPSPIERRDAFIAENPDTVVTPLRLTSGGAFDCGSLAWSPARQRIYLLATGMPANTPSEHRYTLWADSPSAGGPVELARFDITDPVGQVISLPAAGLEGARGFMITLEAASPGIEPASVLVATSDPI